MCKLVISVDFCFLVVQIVFTIKAFSLPRALPRLTAQTHFIIARLEMYHYLHDYFIVYVVTVCCVCVNYFILQCVCEFLGAFSYH